MFLPQSLHFHRCNHILPDESASAITAHDEKRSRKSASLPQKRFPQENA
jgi:hypothetical protein